MGLWGHRAIAPTPFYVAPSATPRYPGTVPGIVPFVAEVWAVHLEPGKQHAVLPDGCVDLVFRGGDGPELFWVGAMTRAEFVGVEGPTDFVGVRFRPGVAPGILGVDARDWLDQDVPANDARLLDALVATPNASARHHLLLHAVARRRVASPDPVVVALSDAILATGGELRVGDLAQRAGLSERTLRRRFGASVGYGPKQLCRVARLQRARTLGRVGLGGATLAARAGYYDQAHLCHELASFGLTSTSLLG